MPKYLVLALPLTEPVENDGSGDMDAWVDWFKAAGDAIVDVGAPLGDRRALGQAVPTQAMGYMMVQAGDLDAAERLVAASPAAGAMEVIEVTAMPGHAPS